MPKVNYKKPSPKLDMNPMVDLAFLLVTFFMLTTTFKTEEPAVVDMPSSHSELKLPDVDMLTILVDKEGTPFFSLEGKATRKRVLELMGQRYNVEFTEDEKEAFSLVSGFGVPIAELKGWINLDPDQRRQYDQSGIPMDTINNELRDWTVFARIANPKVRIALKGDRNTPYPVVSDIMDMLVTNNINRFNLITDLEAFNSAAAN